MKASRECFECLAGLAAKATVEACADDDNLRFEAARGAGDYLIGEFLPGRSVPTRLATGFLRIIREISENPDPFAKAKEEEYKRGVKACKKLRESVGDQLEDLIALSNLGNRIDFFRPLEEVEREWESGKEDFALLDFEKFFEDLDEASTVMILGDNCGELPFDLPLVEFLEKEEKEVFYCVKGAASQNDLTRKDLAKFEVKLNEPVDTGNDWVGFEVGYLGEKGFNAWKRSDIVISKGMANLETISEYPEEIERKKLYFSLVAKCGPVAKFTGLDKGTGAFFSKERLPKK